MARRRQVEAEPEDSGPKHRYVVKRVKPREVRDRDTGEMFVGEWELLDMALPPELRWIETFRSEDDANKELNARLGNPR